MAHFEEYKKQTEPEKYKKAENWGIAIGLQQVDGLTPSKYLIEVAKDNIEGKISIDEANEQITRYYKQNPIGQKITMSDKSVRVKWYKSFTDRVGGKCLYRLRHNKVA